MVQPVFCIIGTGSFFLADQNLRIAKIHGKKWEMDIKIRKFDRKCVKMELAVRTDVINLQVDFELALIGLI